MRDEKHCDKQILYLAKSQFWNYLPHVHLELRYGKLGLKIKVLPGQDLLNELFVS